MNYSDIYGAEPGEVIRPATTEEVRAAVAHAWGAGGGVLPWGGGTGQDYGYPPRRADYLLDLSGLNRVVAHEVDDLTITVQPGVTFADLQNTLAARNQYLPLDPPQPERATIGGALATNAFGPSRIGHGTARDWLIGLSVVDAQGRVIRGGGKVVKNVTGYDLPKLHIGALGTLGVIVEATFKVAPKPEAHRTVLVRRGAASGSVGAFVRQALEETAPAKAYLHSGESGSFAIFGFAGPVEVVEDAVGRVRAAADRHLAGQPGLTLNVFEEDLEHEAPDAPLALRFACPPADAFAQHEATCAGVGDAGAAQVETLLGVGVTSVFWPAADAGAQEVADALRHLAREQGRSCAVLRAPLAFRARPEVDLWSPLPPSFPLMERMKATLDPDGVLNPGRFVGRL
ncbi:MAG TPA: FAD-binding oxidoreductase [Armatimonadaceae bacterium]|nr:FAD-binding oxidoreductase [Armatimonadaceae bacterium]